jgi:peptide-methionine (S)-S-oxide reductase
MTMRALAAVAAVFMLGGAAAPPGPADREAVAVFAGGCFWSMEKAFDQVAGVTSTTSGFAGGTTKAPTYAQVSAGGTGHVEAVRVAYDPTKVTYAGLLDAYWHNVDPLTADAQFCDHGAQYATAVFVSTPAERKLAEATKAALAKRFGKPVVTRIEPAGPFWPAEEAHQDFHVRHPVRYNAYRSGCGRDQRLEALWGKAAVH